MHEELGWKVTSQNDFTIGVILLLLLDIISFMDEKDIQCFEGCYYPSLHIERRELYLLYGSLCITKTVLIASGQRPPAKRSVFLFI